MTTKERLHQIIEQISDQEAEQMLDWLELRSDPDQLTPAEAADLRRIHDEMRQGEYVTLEDLRKVEERCRSASDCPGKPLRTHSAFRRTSGSASFSDSKLSVTTRETRDTVSP